jgi:hypothetical protein
VDLVLERIQLRRPLRTPKRRRLRRAQRRADPVPANRVRLTSSLIGTPRTKCSRRNSAQRSTSSTPSSRLDRHDRARVDITLDASATIQGGQISTGEGGSVSHRCRQPRRQPPNCAPRSRSPNACAGTGSRAFRIR